MNESCPECLNIKSCTASKCIPIVYKCKNNHSWWHCLKCKKVIMSQPDFYKQSRFCDMCEYSNQSSDVCSSCGILRMHHMFILHEFQQTTRFTCT